MTSLCDVITHQFQHHKSISKHTPNWTGIIWKQKDCPLTNSTRHNSSNMNTHGIALRMLLQTPVSAHFFSWHHWEVLWRPHWEVLWPLVEFSVEIAVRLICSHFFWDPCVLGVASFVQKLLPSSYDGSIHIFFMPVPCIRGSSSSCLHKQPSWSDASMRSFFFMSSSWWLLDDLIMTSCVISLSMFFMIWGTPCT